MPMPLRVDTTNSIGIILTTITDDTVSIRLRYDDPKRRPVTISMPRYKFEWLAESLADQAKLPELPTLRRTRKTSGR